MRIYVLMPTHKMVHFIDLSFVLFVFKPEMESLKLLCLLHLYFVEFFSVSSIRYRDVYELPIFTLTNPATYLSKANDYDKLCPNLILGLLYLCLLYRLTTLI